MVQPIYCIFTITSALFLFLILLQSTYISKIDKTGSCKDFICLLCSAIFFMLNDTAWGHLSIISSCYGTPFFLCSSLFHVLINLTLFFWVNFSISCIENKIVHVKLLRGITIGFLSVNVILVIVNFFVPIIFYISEDGQYVPLHLRNILFVIQYLVYSGMAVLAFFHFIKDKSSYRMRYLTVFAAAMPPLICAVFQYKFYYAPFHSIGYLFCCGIIQSFIVTRDHFEFAEKKNAELTEVLLSMTDEYDTLFTVDLDSGKINVLRCKNECFDKILNKIENLEFEKFVYKFSEFFVIPSDREKFSTSLSTRVIWNNVQNQKPYYVIYQLAINGMNHWYETKLMSTDPNAKKRNCVAGFRCIDTEVQNELVVQNEIRRDKQKLVEQLEILSSISGIYAYVNLMDFSNGTIIRFDSEEKKVDSFSMQNTHQSNLNKILNMQIIESQQKDFYEFTDLQTIRQRLENKKSISQEFMNTVSGWFRSQYILVNKSADGNIEKIIYTVQNIDEEKKREQQLIHKSEVDEITGLLNRKAYERHIFEYTKEPIPDNFIFASMDLNGLKEMNDNQGHDAGDELLKAAAFCMKKTFGSYGSVFRIGGDEFAAMFFAGSKEFNAIKHDFNSNLLSYKGDAVNEIAVAVGYVRKSEFKDMPIQYITKMADKRMYKSKNAYYENRGVDRRGLQVAYSTLCKTYIRILKVDLLKNRYAVIRTDDKVGNIVEHNDPFFDLIDNFGHSDSIAPEDRERFISATMKENLLEVFSSSKGHFQLTYNRLVGNEYKTAYMEMIPAKEFSSKHKVIFVYVKIID